MFKRESRTHKCAAYLASETLARFCLCQDECVVKKSRVYVGIRHALCDVDVCISTAIISRGAAEDSCCGVSLTLNIQDEIE